MHCIETTRFPRFGRAPTDGVTPRRQLASVRVTVEEPELADRLLSLSKSDANGLDTILQAAWALLLRCYTGQDHVSFGIQRVDTVDNADVVVAQFLLNESLAISEISGAATIHAKTGTAAVTSDGDASAPVANTAIVLWGFTPRSTSSLDTISNFNVQIPALQQQQQIRLLAKRGHEGTSLGLFVEWNTNIVGVPAGQGKLVASTLAKAILTLLASPPETKLGELDLTSRANREQVCAWNDAVAIDTVDRCVHHVIADRVDDRPELEAVCAWDGSLTYRELDALATSLATRLVQLGVGPEVMVPICFNKSKWTVVSMLAVLKAGGAFVPLDPSHPVERLRDLCQSVNAHLVLCSRHLTTVVDGVVDAVLPVDDETLAEQVDLSVSPPTSVSSTNPAYVIFTSGSTGKPKGTVIEHRAFCSSARAHGPALRIDGSCRVLQFAAHTFDASLVEILTPLMVGGCVCIPDETERLNDLAGAINRLGVNHAVLTPSFVGFLSPSAVPGLRRLVLAGEAMAPSHVATWSHINLVNGYGPAESSVAAVVNSHVGPDTEATDIGMPCGVRCWLVDPADHNRLVPVGCVGELLLEGPSLARGYLNDPAKTEESFIFDPAWADATGAAGRRRFYKTGDLARYNSGTGSLSYVGRKDTQIKLHGQRIELGEIEHHLAVDASVKHAMILLPKLGPLKKRLVAVLSLDELTEPMQPAATAGSNGLRLCDNISVTEPILQEIRARLTARLPAYMVPSVWLCVDAIPMLPSRKMDRKSVTTWVESVISQEECQRILMGHNSGDAKTSVKDNEEIQPLTETEATLRGIWSLVLNLPAAQISLDDRSFLSLGGDSISAMACASRAKKAQLGLTVQEVLRAKSLRQLAAGAKKLKASNEGRSAGEEETELLNVPFALSPIQQLHFQVRGEAEGDEHFNQSFCLRLGRHVDATLIRDAIETIVKRHAMLRARFERSPEDGQWRQFITPDVGRSYRFRAHSVRSAHLVDAGIADSQGCLSVRRGPIFAAELFAVEDSGQEILFMTAHHLVIDLVSWRVILEEMEELLEKQHLAPHPSLSFRSWTVLQKEHCINAPVDHSPPFPPTQFEYWGMQAQPNLYGDVICHGFSLDPTTTNTLLSSACQNSLRTEPVDLLLAALLQSFATTFSDRSPPAIFNEGHGREPPSPETTDISRTVGWFTTLFPITASFGTSTPEFTDTLIQTKDLRRRAPGNGRQFFASQFYHPSSNSDHRRADMRRMEVTFNFLGRYQQLERPGALFAPAALLAGEAHSGNGTADFGRAAPRFALVEISAVVVKDVLRFAFAWNRHMLRQDELRRWVDLCSAVLRDAARILPGVKPRFTAGDLTLLPGLKGEELVKFEREKLKPLTGDSAWEKVEDVYPASPIQEGLLMSRTKDGSFYAVRRVFKVALRGDGGEVDVRRLVQAWEGVVMHHALLRTVFVDAISEARAGSHDQLVLKRVDMESLIAVYECRGGEDDMRKMVDRMESMQYSADKPQHRLSIFHSIRARSVCCVLEMSHAIMDGASMDILLRDLARSYAGSIGNTPKPLFSPFMASLQQRNAEADIGFWTSYLTGIEPCHFPVLNDGINLPESTRELRSLRVSVPNLAALQSFCDAKGFTLPNAFHAAWGLTLACYTASDDVCFGYLVSGRDAALVEGSEDAIGPFINMVTQRVKLRGEKDDENALSLLRVLEATQRDQLDSMPHAQASLAEVQHALKMPGGMALFNTCISYRRRLLSQQSATTEALECTDLEAIHDPTEYPISLNIETSDDGEDGATTAAIDIDYWTDAVCAGQAEHVAATFVHALTNIAEHAEIPLSQLDIVHESSKSAIWAWNASLPPTTADCIHHMIAKQVSLRAQSQAVRGWDADFSYAELDRLSSSLAAHLVSLGVAPEVFVPVCFDKSAWTVVSMLAVLKAGGGVVPLDATHPADALEGKVVDAGAHVVVASETRAAIFEAMVPYVVAVGPRLMAQLQPEPEQDSATVSPSDPAFVMFTSGSTGKPKGVVLCHQALVSSALAHGAALGLGPHTRFLQFAAHTFDNSLEEMFTTLIHGGCVCVPSEADRLGDLPGAIDRLDANFMDLTPTVAALLRPNDMPKIRGLAVGGEALTQEVLDIWGGAIPLHNQYGPSECSINATHRLHSDARGDVANIGTSVGSVSWVVDPRDHDRLVPVGCVGELLIEGPILARGYLGRPAETAKAFIEMPKWAVLDPRHDERGARRMYKTGDLVRYNSDGSLVYLCRKDTQVKLHGQRIELGEIEHHVKAVLPEGAQSSVELVTLGHSQQKMLAVFFCLSANPATTKVEILPMSADFHDLAHSIAGALSVKLAAYMVPNVFFPVSQMPLTSSGKLDRRRLRTAAQALSDDGVLAYRLGARTVNGRLPKTAMEKELQALWASVLKVEPASIGAEDSFFRHGGDSVGAMRLVAAARQRGIVLAVATIFQTPKLADMAATITATSSERPSGQGANVQPIPGPAEPFSLVKLDKTMTVQGLRDHVAHICRVGVESVEDIYPCTPLQAGMVAASQRQPGAYVAVNSYRLPYRTDIDLFKKAWQDVVDSEAILRTRVVFIEGMGFLQVVVRGSIDWLTAPSHNDLPKTYSHLPMQDGGELSRYALIQAPHEGQQTTFVWAAHHALYDGWSLPTLLSRVEARYSRPQAPIPPVPHYSRFVEYLCNTDLSASDAFWRSKLSGPAPRHFPSLPHPGYRVQAASQLHRCVRFAKPKGSDLTTASFLRAGWALVLAIYASSDDVVFGEVLSGRDVPVAGVEDLIGPTLASVPRRIRIDRNGAVQRVLADVQAQLNDVIPHQFAGLQRIKSLGPEAAVACEFQNLLAIDMTEDMPQEGLWEELASGGNKQGADFFNYPLNVTCALKGEGEIDVCAYFDHAVVPQWQVVRMLAQFETVLQRVSDVRRQNDKVGDVDLLSQDDKALVRELNRVPGPVVERRVQDVIADQMASRGASEEAVVGWDATLSNAELDTLSTALACELACNGMNRGKLVPFCFEKSAFAVVAMLAVLKAGAAFVPLDPAHPVSRLKEIVGDCEASVIVCSPRYSGLCSELVDVVLPVDGNSLRTIVDAQRSSTDVTEATEICSPTDPAYVIFTSGTTGKPKGTIISHLAICSGAAAHGPPMLMNPPFRCLQFASYTFDASLFEILTTLMRGGTVCVPCEEDRTNGNLAAAMERMRVDLSLLTPSVAQTLQPADVPHLKTLILGGEAMAQGHLDTWADKVNLVNAYGPSECAIVATVNSNMKRSSNPVNLGRGIGRCWIVDPNNHDRLAPVGSAGELLIEGPTMSSGYLRNEAKTREVFIENPQWALDEALRYPDMPQTAPRRMYKTGDLVRICDDVSGEMVYLGRKDSSQAKLNGQRLELDEVAHHLGADDAIRHALVLFPKSGPCAKRLVAVLALQGFSASIDTGAEFELVTSKAVSLLVDQVEERLRSKVPAYMVPSTWIVLSRIPLLPSGKLDRRGVADFVDKMSEDMFDKVTGNDAERETEESALTQNISLDATLRTIWSEVLNISPERIGRHVSFLHLGGDSITAMQVMARCRTQGIKVAVQDIINSRSVHDLALRAGVPMQQQPAAFPGEDHYEFDLTPIQQLYFQLLGENGRVAGPDPDTMRFNQSVLLRLNGEKIDPQEIGRAVHTLVQTHSMLRSRFRRDGTGSWRQRITSDISGSYRFKAHAVGNLKRVEKRIQTSQKALDIQKGPLLAADCFTVGGDAKKELFIFITIHHLVIDVVSWGILLQDLEDFFSSGSIKPVTSLSFQMWSRKQAEHAQAEQNGPRLLPHHEFSDVDLEYWGMGDKCNAYGDVVTTNVELDSETTSMLLGPECHKPLQTEPLDVLLAALLLSYRNASVGRRGNPTIYNEGHGREVWDDAMDLSRTVGWFTTLYPVHLPNESSSDNDIINAVRWVKDYRRRLAGKGRPYFAYSLLTSQGRDEYGHQWPVEVAFNYLGQMQQLSRTDTFLSSIDGIEQTLNSPSDIGKDAPRFALIDVSALVEDGKMKLSFTYNSHMKHQDSLAKWAQQCKSLLRDATDRLTRLAPWKTLSEFPLLSLSYYGLDNLRQNFEDIGLRLDQVEDIYPCSPTQRGLLLSQMREPDKYAYRAVFQIMLADEKRVDPDRLCNAWQGVIRRHATLRTVFVDTVGDEGLMDQVVLREALGRTIMLQSSDESGALTALGNLQGIDYREKKPPHRLALCTTADGSVFCQLEISHAICDGSSLPILLDDLSRYYRGTTNEPLPVYKEYMAFIQAQPRNESIAYWKRYLDGAEPCLFPALIDGKVNTERSLGSQTIQLDHLTEMNQYCANAGITLSTLLQFAWALVLHTYTGSEDVLFGYLASGRDVPVPHIEQAVGAFINMLVCRLHISADIEVEDAIDTMQNNFAKAMAHQTCSLAEMQHALQLPAAGALFNTAFTYQKRSGPGQNRDSISSALEYRVINAEDPSEYAVAVNVEATEGSVEVQFGYWRNIVSDEQMENVASAFQQAVSDLVDNCGQDDRTVGEVDLVGSTGIQRIFAWNDYEIPRVEQCVHDVIAQHASQLPTSPAVCGWDASFTYAELDGVATAVARRLVDEFGVGPEAFVPLCFEKSAWTVVAQLAVLKAGGAFVGLDPEHPETRLRELIGDVGAKVVLCSAKYEPKLVRITPKTAVVDANTVAVLRSGTLDAMEITVATPVKPSNAAYIIFTSGTTGKPKGTIIEHASFCTGALAHAKAMFMRSDSRVLQFASYTFDASIMETLSCLLVGGCVCVPSDEDRMNDLAAVIRSMRVTWTLLTPSVASTVKPDSVPCLRTLVTGGEAMAAGHVGRWGTKCALVNAYGPTECSVVATTSTKVDEAHRVRNEDSSNIGTAVGGRVWVVDSSNPDRLVPPGAVGELVVEGRLVARGYLNNPEQTVKAFIQTPPQWTGHPAFPASMWRRHERMYRTGDLVRYNSDGSVSYVARKDTQIKLNGRRIELGEIEFHCLQGLPEDAQVAVEVVVPPTARSAAKALAVFFSLPATSATGFSLLPMDESLNEAAHTLEKHVSGQLPAYMVPSLFVPVSAMPWTSAGKLDRRRLRQAVEQASKDYVAQYKITGAAKKVVKRPAPASQMETKLRGLWEAILGLPEGSVGPESNFFRIGGDSLTAMRLVGAARAHRIMLSVLDVFEHPVLTEMAQACGGMEAASVAPTEKEPESGPFSLVKSLKPQLDALLQEVSAQCPIPRQDIQDMYPCSPLQEGLVALANKQAGAYVAISTLKLPKDAELTRFKSAWQRVVDDTDMLRTRIVHTSTAGFLQVVVAPGPIDWHAEPSLEEATIKGKALGSQNGGVLTRFAFVRSEQGHTYFVLAIHHALYDGWSLPRIARRVQDIYEDVSSLEKIHARTNAPYANFIRYLAGQNVKASERFWTDALSGSSSVTHFPESSTIANRNMKPTFGVETIRVQVNRNTFTADITLPTLVRAAWAITLAAYTGTDDVVFGETLAGRNIDLAGVEDIAGPTFTTVPVRVQPSRHLRLPEFLREMHKLASRLAPHQHLGLQHIRRLNQDCEAACNFQNILTIQAASPSLRRQRDDDWDFQGGSSMESFFTHSLVLECNVTDATIEATFHHDENVLSSWHARRLAKQLEAILSQMVAMSRNANTTLAEIHVLSSEDQALIADWNRFNGEFEVEVNACIHDLFTDQASRHPERAAISAWDAELTYGEVREYASRLAVQLSQLNVRPGSLIPVCLTRSAWSLVTLLGVLMAGGAFVPFDPAHPLGRQKDMLASLNPSLIVCSPEYTARFASITSVPCFPVDGNTIRGLPLYHPTVSLAKSTPQSTAYVLFTSGSTGTPKGVVATHLAFCSSSRGFAAATNLTPSSRAFHFASLTFDVALMETLTPLMLGACVCVPSEHERLHDLGGAMARLSATWAFLTPSVANLVEPYAPGIKLKTLVCGGEAMLAETVARWAGTGVELRNGYGPTEACVLAVVNPAVVSQADRAVIGRATSAARAWIVEPREDKNSPWLAPVGAVGELVISGPLLAEGYLGDKEKTSKVFVESPAWGRGLVGSPGPRRIYRTGDLVRYRPDGAIEFIGRKDGQVKVNGQRIELGEIESCLSADRRVRLALVVQPKTGPCQKQLVGIVTLNGESAGDVGGNNNCTPVDGPAERMAHVREDLVEVRGQVADKVPHYMVPSVWIVLKGIPVGVSGKLDRQRVARWVENIDATTLERIADSLGLSEEASQDVQLIPQAQTLREIWAKELHLPVDRVKTNQPFLALGGDSIRAMGVVSRARNAKLTVSLQDVLRSKSVVHLAQLAKVASSSATAEAHLGAETEEPFTLSPIQTMYMKLAVKHDRDARFNQSFALKAPRGVGVDAIRNAVDSIVQRHSMLRARFVKGLDGTWLQRTIKMRPSVYSFLAHRPASPEEITMVSKAAQTSLDIEHGPVFRVDVVDLPVQDQKAIHMVAHHLVVDIVSWRIIVQDLTQILETGILPVESPLFFRAWCALQSEHNKSIDAKALLPFEETPSDLSYWGVDQRLTYGTTATESFTLDENMTKLALGDCHRAFRSKPLDVFLAALAHAFAKTFPDRATPTLHTESHGREAPDGSSIDLSGTVGWFTTICPLQVPIHSNDALDAVKRAKDLRRSIPGNGRPYFAHKWLGRTADAILSPMEVLFNYLGGGVSGSDAEGLDVLRETADVGTEATRMALFEISAVVIDNQLHFSFIYDRNLNKVSDVLKWIANCKAVLEEIVQGLMRHPAEPTLSDYPLLPLDYENLRTLVNVALPRLGIRDPCSCIEDIYPCTPVQDGILISQLRDPNAYIFHAVYSVAHKGSHTALDPGRLARAWQKVVSRHPVLRTVFVESFHSDGVFAQAVLKQPDCGAVIIRSRDGEAMARLSESASMTRGDQGQEKRPQLPHRLTICATDSGGLLMKLEINHAALDGGSLPIILDELAAAYAGTLDSSPGPLYSNYIRYIRSTPTTKAVEYWVDHLRGLKPCHFPKLNADTAVTKRLGSTRLQFDRYHELRRLPERTHVTLANIMNVAWALVLRKYTGVDDICFGFLTAGRDIPVDNIDRIVGTLINMLCCRIGISKSQTLADIFRAAQGHYLQSIPFQQCSLAQVQHELGMAGKPLYNTSISTQNHSGKEDAQCENTISFTLEEGHDPSEYAITVNVDVSEGSEGVVFRYWSDHINDNQAQEVAQAMAQVLNAFLDHPALSVEEFDHYMAAKSHSGRARKHSDSRRHHRLSGVASSESSIDAITWWSPQSDTPETPMSPISNIGMEARQNNPKKMLHGLWTTLLGLPSDHPIDGQDSFFDLGGDSIMAMKLVGEARDQGLTLSVADVFRYPRFDDMAASIYTSTYPPDRGIVGQAAKHILYERFSLLAASNVDAFLQTNIVPQVGVFRGGLADVLPATDFQSLAVTGALLKSRWMLNYFYLDGEGLLDVGQLRRACFRLVQSFDILRTVFVPSGSRFLQVVLRTLRPVFNVVELEDESIESFTKGLQTKGEHETPSLGEPFVGFTVVRDRHSSRHRILIRISHAQYDGVCLPKILDALQAAYRGAAVPCPPSFANYLRASAGTLTSDHYQHWKALLEGSSMTEIVSREHPDHHKWASGPAVWLKKAVRLPPVESGNITTATVVKAAWAYVLAHLSANPDVVFGHTISGRNAAVEGIENMVGPCLNLVPVRVQFSGGTARHMLYQVQEQQVANMPHEVLGFREIIRRCTDWPAWTYFTSTVQHQNIDQTHRVRLGDTDYAIGWCASSTHGDLADIAILSQRQADTTDPHAYEIMMSFAEGGPVPRKLAQQALDMLCDAASLFAANPDTPLPSAAEFSSRAKQIPLPSTSPSPSTPISAPQMDILSAAHQEAVTALVADHWREVLSLNSTSTGSSTIDPETSFFSLGGDLTDLARLAYLLGNDNDSAGSTTTTTPSPALRLEDLAEHHTLRGHVAVLVAAMPRLPRSIRLAAAAGSRDGSREGVRREGAEHGEGVRKGRKGTMGTETGRSDGKQNKLAKALRLVGNLKKISRKRVDVDVDGGNASGVVGM